MLTTDHTDTRRLNVNSYLPTGLPTTIATDVRNGLLHHPKYLLSKYFYDDVGSRMFDMICDTEEYYQTRTEFKLLENIGHELLQTTRPLDLVELGSGAARKTRVLLDAAQALGQHLRYVPLDVNEAMLIRSARSLLMDYPWLQVHGVVGDYEHHLVHLPDCERRLVLYLGGTVGNFHPDEAIAFIQLLARDLNPGDHLLIGVDLVKDHGILNRAYNDSGGLTAAFNLNILNVVNHELDGNFDPVDFEHVAFYNPDHSQIEMHLRARRALKVRLRKLELEVIFEEGEMMRTEVSRKFSQASIEALLTAGGFQPQAFYAPSNQHFGLSLAQVDTSTHHNGDSR